MHNDKYRGMYRAASIVAVLLFWGAFSYLNASYFKFYNPLLIPSPADVFRSGVELTESGVLQQSIGASLFRVAMGFFFAAVAAILAALAVTQSRVLENIIEPLVDLLRPIPTLAFLPMMVLWFGIGETSKIVFIAYTTFFSIFTAVVQGMRQIDPVLIRAASSLGADRRQRFFHVTLPAATPSIITGLRIGIGLAFFVIVAAEFIAADSGLGFMIHDARTFFDVSRMMLGAIVIGLLGFVVNFLLRQLENYLLRWRAQDRG